MTRGSSSSGGGSSRPRGRRTAPPAARPAASAAPPPSPNDPNSRHKTELKVLADSHKTNPAKPCFWKHEYGSSKGSVIKIPPAEYDTHPCHYRANGLRQAEGVPEVYNTRRITGLKPEKARTDNQEVAKRLGYLKKVGRSKDLSPNTKTEEYATTAPAIAKDKNKSERGKGTRFLTAYRSRYGKSLDWLARDANAWDVNYQMMLEEQEFKSTFGATKNNKAQNYVKLLKRVATELGGKFYLGPINFHFSETNVAGGKGFGKWYPYEHDHHHMVPASAFQKHVLNGDSDAPAVVHYMSRARVVMQGSWNLHHEMNMILLPNETYPARILDLAAHIPWQMGADHKTYSSELRMKLNPARKVIDNALKKAQGEPKKKRHQTEKDAAADFSQKMEKICNDQRKELLKKGFHILQPN